MQTTNTSQMVLAALVLGVVVHPLAAAAGIRAAYGEGAAKTWAEAQFQCQAWGGSLVKAEGALAPRLAKIKCTDVVWVGAHEAPKTRGSDSTRWRWISDASSVAASVWQECCSQRSHPKPLQRQWRRWRSADRVTTLAWANRWAPCPMNFSSGMS